MNKRMIRAHMEVAETYAKLSYAKRLQVGAIIVKDSRVISIGYNGTPSGWDNVCEEIIEVHEDGGVITKTKPEVIHAEANAIAKLARSSEAGENATMFVTHAPCMECAKLVFGAGIKNLFYRTPYRDNSGVNFLTMCGVEVEQV